jgi:hypothetical protein
MTLKIAAGAGDNLAANRTHTQHTRWSRSTYCAGWIDPSGLDGVPRRKAQFSLLLKHARTQPQNDWWIYHGFPKRLHHVEPHWVKPGALFHICVALDREKNNAC